MSSHDDDDDKYPKYFRVADVNVLKLNQAVDLEILIAEADYSTERIKAQIKEGFGDQLWLEDATRAMRDIQHKKGLAELKLVAVRARDAKTAALDAGDKFNGRFMKIAKEFMPPDEFAKYMSAARFG